MENGEKRGGSGGPPGTPETPGTPGSPGGTRRLKEYYEQLWSGGDKSGSPVHDQKRTGKLCYPDCHPHPHPSHTPADNTDYQWIKLK